MNGSKENLRVSLLGETEESKRIAVTLTNPNYREIHRLSSTQGNEKSRGS